MTSIAQDGIHFLLVVTFCAAGVAAGPKAANGSKADLAFFENRIRPALVQHCYTCHSADADEVGGKLRLDSAAGILNGGESGAALIAGQPDKSLLIQAMRYDGLQMPPDQQLPEAVIADFVQWIQRGAVDPRTEPSPAKHSSTADQDQPSHSAEALWAYQPVSDPIVPVVSDTGWPRDSIDHFVLAKIEAAGLQPTAAASTDTLIRRLYVDLIGLPPTFEVAQQFVRDCDTDRDQAVAAVVDNLLSSPHFGERWGRHWLDVARYGESNGNDGLGRNPTFPHAWRYRDYVIDAFNRDVPYNRFLTEQIAGDLLPHESPAQHDRQRIATGFLALASKPAKAMNNDFHMDVVADQIDVIGTGIMGISVACARCHDHKFDPIPTRDYYALAGFFTSSETLWGLAANEGLTAPTTELHVLEAAPKVLPPADFKETVFVLESNTGVPKPIPKPPWPIGTPLAMGVRDKKEPADCKINIKGNSKKLGEAVPRGFLSAYQMKSQPIPEFNAEHSGRRELARWLTQDDHPQTSRVMVNRIWQHLFGHGIVRTPDDFGVYGERPTHPLLLDHLAHRFVSQGWSIKTIIRSIVLSRTYQLSSQADASLLAGDRENQLLTRHHRRRLDAESLRDRMLQVSGQLDATPADGSLVRYRDILVNLAGNLHQSSRHRSVYLCYLRSSPPPELAAFNLPEFTTVTGQRDVSTVPGQALHLFNNDFVIDQAAAFAKSLQIAADSNEDRVQIAWRRAFGRRPTDDEMQSSKAFLGGFAKGREANAGKPAEDHIWASFCQALFAANEFRYVD